MSFVLNPKTNRMIKIGGKPWRKLVREGMLPNDPITPIGGGNNTLYEAKNEKEAEQAREEILTEQVRTTAAQKLTKNQVPGRKGKKVVKITNPPKHEDLARYTASCASRTLHKHINDLSDQLEYAYSESNELDNSQLKEFEDNLKDLILQEMISGEVNKPPDVNTRKKRISDETDYECEEYYEDEEDDEKSD